MYDRPLPLAALQIGPLAQSALTGDGQIQAVFASVFYINLSGKLIAIGPDTIDPGPITLTSASLDWRKLGLTVGKKCRVQNKILHIPGLLIIDLKTATPWTPPHTATPTRPAQLPPNLAPPAEGYGRSIADATPPPEVAALAHWLKTALSGPAHAPPTDLLGRGPGLTPSGDDLLGGTMIALHALGHAPIALHLWHHLEALARTRTNAISRALLAAAAQGMGSEALHHAMNAYFIGKNLAPALASLDTIGHSSGWDAFVGVVLATRAVQSARHPA